MFEATAIDQGGRSTVTVAPSKAIFLQSSDTRDATRRATTTTTRATRRAAGRTDITVRLLELEGIAGAASGLEMRDDMKEGTIMTNGTLTRMSVEETGLREVGTREVTNTEALTRSEEGALEEPVRRAISRTRTIEVETKEVTLVLDETRRMLAPVECERALMSNEMDDAGLLEVAAGPETLIPVTDAKLKTAPTTATSKTTRTSS